ncbi:signal peptidase II [Desulfomonile tiedjei]|uniref:Lipoprotein signal peptidase n=1 Tax=Desulfomonile tiedjei (strain ATCC 49306 / DSM 6799 / DCB-1) TaxID=706587 RepID=I4CAY1_DESTA|nr:signal peptidase II [Desulfomonile tiedjei]AFM26722.1 signal peptidase II [Desulfomonile tiedjei DSM 6799]
MKVSNRRNISMAFGIALLIVVADQFTKYLVTAWIPLHTVSEVIPGFVNLVHVRNPGAAFGIFSDSQSMLTRWFFVCISIAAVMIIGWLILTGEDTDTYLLVGYALFVGGALGNLIDRIRFGAVVDFLELYVNSFHWPAFNVADSALCVGTALFFIHVLTAKKRNGAEA